MAEKSKEEGRGGAAQKSTTPINMCGKVRNRKVKVNWGKEEGRMYLEGILPGGGGGRINRSRRGDGLLQVVKVKGEGTQNA